MDSYLTDNVRKRAERMSGNAEDEQLSFAELGNEWTDLFHQSSDIFNEVQTYRQQRGQEEADLHSKILGASSRYFLLLENAHSVLSGSPHGHQADNDYQNRIQYLRSLMLMWKLFQTVFIEDSQEFQVNGSMAYIFRLQNLQSFVGNPLRKMPKIGDGRSNSSIWQTIARFVLIGNFPDAFEALRRLTPEVRSDPAVQVLGLVLDESPLMDPSSHPDAIVEWRAQIADLVESPEVQSRPEVRQIFRLMLGFFEEWTIVGHEFTSWLAFYNCRLLHLGYFPSPIALSQDLKLFSEARIGCRNELFPAEIDSAVEAVLKVDWDEALEILRSHFRNLWFSVHMWDLFDLSGTLTSANLLDHNLSSVIREGLIIEYVQGAVRSGKWLPFVHYLKYCETHGLTTICELLVEIETFSSIEDRREVLKALEADGMESAVRLIHEREALSAAKCGDFESAMESANLCDPEFRIRVANLFIGAVRQTRQSLEFRNSDKVVMALLPDHILQRLGIPGFCVIYEKAIKNENYIEALSYLTLLLTRTSDRKSVYDFLERVNDCVSRIRAAGNAPAIQTHRQLRDWLMKLPLTNLKPSSQNEKIAVRELEKEMFKAAAWSFDQFSAYAANLK